MSLRPRSGTSLLPILVGALFIGCNSDAGDAAAEPGDPAIQQAAPPGAMDPAVQQEQMAMVAEIQMIDQQLAPIRERTMAENPEFAEREQELVGQMQDIMEEISPGIGEKRTQFETLMTEYEEAQAAQDTARVQTLGGQLQALNAELGSIQTQALQHEDLQGAIESFREDLFERMRETDPRADSLLDRGQELSDQLEAASSGS